MCVSSVIPNRSAGSRRTSRVTMKCSIKLLLLLSAVSIHMTHAANILAFAIIPSYSHQIPVLAITRALATRGHNVTVITANPSKEEIANYTQIDVSDSYRLMKEGKIELNLSMKIDSFTMIKQVFASAVTVAETQLKSPPLKHFMSWAKDVKFDVALYENLYISSYLGLIHMLGSPPVIGISTAESNMPFATKLGSPLNLAYTPFWMPFTDHMSFYERLINIAFFFWFSFHRDWHTFPEHDRIIRELFGEGFPSSKEMERNISLLMYTASGSMYYPHALTPNIVKVGPTHIQKPKPLPDTLEKWVSGSKEGVIYFSLGSNMQGTVVPTETREAFLTVFSLLKNYRVIWKWESDQYYPGQPENVMFQKWVPQQDLLAHPKVKLFITQGGLQSTEEAVHFGVPMVGIPLFGDQSSNMHKLATVEAAVVLDFEHLNKDNIFAAVDAVLHDPKYHTNIKRLSDISKDTILSPVEQAVWWVEYVIRYNGARHLRPATLDLHWTQCYLIDVAAFVIAVVCVTVFSAFKLVQFVYRRYTIGVHRMSRIKQKKS